jgi:peptidoglycan pentaglycine glycine transferase (the first glycine)
MRKCPIHTSIFYGDWQRNLGRTVKRFTVSSDTKIIAYFQIIKYPLLLGKSYLYIPYGPVTKVFSHEFFAYIKQELKKIAKINKAVFVRLDFTPPTIPNNILSSFFTKASLCTYHSAYFQPRTEWFLDVRKSENELLVDMHEKTRYSIRLADRKEITVEIITENFERYSETFYDLMLITAKRNGFQLHSKEYYTHIFQNLSPEHSYLSIARYGEKVLAIDMVIVFGKIANYVFGASSNEERNRMPTYSAQWKAICHAKQLNCDYYNFGGIATENNIYKGWEGLTIFKKKFGGKEVTHSDFFDVVTDPLIYYLYNVRKYLKKYHS